MIVLFEVVGVKQILWNLDWFSKTCAYRRWQVPSYLGNQIHALEMLKTSWKSRNMLIAFNSRYFLFYGYKNYY